MSEDILGALAAVAVAIGIGVFAWYRASAKRFDPDELVTVAEFVNETEAALWQDRLKSLGVQAIVFGNGVRRYAFPTEAYPGISLQVRASDVPRAQAILSEGKMSEFTARH